MKRISLISAMLLIFMTTIASAHSIWINCFESYVHKPGHAIVSLGWGHTLPIDDIFNTAGGRMSVTRFELFDPAMKKIALSLPSTAPVELSGATENVDIYPADLAMQKIVLKENSAPGVYQLAATSRSSFFTQYIDKKGRKRIKMKALDEIKDIDKILKSVRYQAFAKSYMILDSWSKPEALGHGLEIIPRSDMSKLHFGDLVEVDVLFYGQPLHSSDKTGLQYITATSSGFGQPENFALFSKIKNGKAQFRVPGSGQWVINASHRRDITKDGPLKDLYGKANQVYHAASLTFTVK